MPSHTSRRLSESAPCREVLSCSSHLNVNLITYSSHYFRFVNSFSFSLRIINSRSQTAGSRLIPAGRCTYGGTESPGADGTGRLWADRTEGCRRLQAREPAGDGPTGQASDGQTERVGSGQAGGIRFQARTPADARQALPSEADAALSLTGTARLSLSLSCP